MNIKHTIINKSISKLNKLININCQKINKHKKFD